MLTTNVNSGNITFVNTYNLLHCSLFLTTFVNITITTMNTRLQQFLSAENLTQSQLADRLGVAKASISHILAGRNKPGFDFIESLAHQFPDLNLDWLIMGTGKMYKNTLFDSPVDETPEYSSPKPVEIKQKVDIKPSIQPQLNNNLARSIVKIVVFYDDNSYQELK